MSDPSVENNNESLAKNSDAQINKDDIISDDEEEFYDALENKEEPNNLNDMESNTNSSLSSNSETQPAQPSVVDEDGTSVKQFVNSSQSAETQTDVETATEALDEEKKKATEARDDAIRKETLAKQEQPGGANPLGTAIKNVNSILPDFAVAIAHAQDALGEVEKIGNNIDKNVEGFLNNTEEKVDEFLKETDKNIEGIKNAVFVVGEDVSNCVAGLLGTHAVISELEKTLQRIKEFFGISYSRDNINEELEPTEKQKKEISIFNETLERIESQLDTLALSAENDDYIIEQCKLTYEKTHPSEKINLQNQADREKAYKAVFLEELKIIIQYVFNLRESLKVNEENQKVNVNNIKIELLKFYNSTERSITLEGFKRNYYTRTEKTIKYVGDACKSTENICNTALPEAFSAMQETAERLRPDHDKYTFFLFVALGHTCAIVAVVWLRSLLKSGKCCPKENIETWAVLALFCFGFIFSAVAYRKTEKAGYKEYQGFFCVMVPGLLIAGAGIIYALRIFDKAPPAMIPDWNNETILCFVATGLVIALLIITGLYYGIQKGYYWFTDKQPKANPNPPTTEVTDPSTTQNNTLETVRAS